MRTITWVLLGAVCLASGCAPTEATDESERELVGGTVDTTIVAWARVLSSTHTLAQLDAAIAAGERFPFKDCVAAIISKRVVLTAAHCLVNFSPRGEVPPYGSFAIKTKSRDGRTMITRTTDQIDANGVVAADFRTLDMGGKDDLGLLWLRDGTPDFDKDSYPALVANTPLLDANLQSIQFSVVGAMQDGALGTDPVVISGIRYFTLVDPTRELALWKYMTSETIYAERGDSGGFVRNPDGAIVGVVSGPYGTRLPSGRIYEVQLDAKIGSTACGRINRAIADHRGTDDRPPGCTDLRPGVN